MESNFMQVARDPGRAAVPVTARSLALGGVSGDSGLADDALASPASLMLVGGTDVVASGGWLLFRRDEVASSPNLGQTSPIGGITSARRWTPLGYVAVATRQRHWAAAGFLDASSRYAHGFDGSSYLLEWAFLYGAGYEIDGNVHAKVDQFVTRVGGAFAAAPSSGRVAVGLSVYGVRLDYNVGVDVDGILTSVDYQHQVTKKPLTARDAVAFGGWAPGVVLGGMVRPASNVAVLARWQQEPSFNAVRTMSVSGAYAEQSSRTVEFRLPSTFAIGTRVTFGRTTAVVDVARSFYSETFQLPAAVDGWDFGIYAPADANSIRAGVEQAVPVGRNRLILRGGAAFDAAYSLAPAPGAVPPQLPVPPNAPTAQRSTWASLGGGYQVGRLQLDGAVAFTGSGLVRILADFRVQLP